MDVNPDVVLAGVEHFTNWHTIRTDEFTALL